MSARRAPWKLVTPTAYRRPHKPGRRVVLIASGLAVSTVVAGLAVLGSINPTPRSGTAPALPAQPHLTSSTALTTTSGAVPPTSTSVPAPTGSHALDAYGGTYPPAVTSTGGYLTPTVTPTTTAPPPATTTSGGDTYTMTYGSTTVVIIYPGGGYPVGDDGGHDGAADEAAVITDQAGTRAGTACAARTFGVRVERTEPTRAASTITAKHTLSTVNAVRAGSTPPAGARPW